MKLAIMVICRDCTVFDHCKPEHKFVNLQTAAKGQKESIKKLAEECKKLALLVDGAIENDSQAVKKLNASVKEAEDNLAKSYEQAKSSILAQLEANYATLSADIKTKGASGHKDIECHTEELRTLRTRLRTTLETASQLIKTGSDCDIAQMYGPVTTSLEELRDIKHPPVQEKMMEGIVFKENTQASKNVTPIGSVSSNTKELRIKKKKWQRQIYTPESSNLSFLSDIVLVKDSIDEICCVHGAVQAYVISNNTHRKIPKKGPPYGIACNAIGEYYVTGGDSNVYRFSSGLAEKGSFSTKPQNKTGFYQAVGIATMKNNTVVVGVFRGKRISMHSQDGARVRVFSVSVHPYHLSVNSQDHLAVSCNGTCCKSVVVVDMEQSGRVVFTVKAPPGVTKWYPSGVCWTKTDDLFIVNFDGEKGIHQFSSSGEYKGCVITGLNSPTCLAISSDDKMLIGDGACIKHVKVYHLT